MDEIAQNRKIEEQMARSMEEEALTIKLLLLGPGDCGKTTFRKQMRNLFGTGFPTEMREEFAPVILNILLSGFQEVLHVMSTHFNLALTNPDAGASALKQIEAAMATNCSELDQATVDACNTLLADAGFQQALARRSEYQLQDCWSTFADKLQQYSTSGWAGPKWLPSTEDCVACRVRTTGIQEERFKIDSIPFLVVDVGGQRSERRKWMNCFDGVTAIIFLAAVSEYDQVLFEDKKTNRLEESLDLFEEVCNIKAFANVDIILFLNKRDLFEKKFAVQGIPLDAVKFPGAPPPHDAKACLAYIEKLFLARNPKKQRKIFVHVTTATDPENVRHTFAACKNILLSSALSDSGFRGGDF